MKKTGILIMALGHPYYGRMAFNLAVSLKNAAPDVPIALVYEGNSLKHLDLYPVKEYIDVLIEAPEKCYRAKSGEAEYIRAKTCIYELSPFQRTLFLDADMLWMPDKPVSALLEELEGTSLTFCNRDFIEMDNTERLDEFSFWGDLKEFRDVYAITEGKYYALHSEFVYFEKSKETKEYFDLARKIYLNPKIKAATFAGAIADELAFGMAAAIKNITFPKTPFVPVFWQGIQPQHPKLLHELKEYYAYSAGGHQALPVVKQNYDTLARWHFQKAELQHPYLLKAKRSFLPERQSI